MPSIAVVSGGKIKEKKTRKEVLIKDREINPGVGPLECFTRDEVPTLPTPLTSLIGQFPDTGDGDLQSLLSAFLTSDEKYLDIKSDKNIYTNITVTVIFKQLNML